MYLPNHTFYSRNRPVVPLPNPGEGGPVYPGPDASTPVIPLPNPDEGGPVYPGPPLSAGLISVTTALPEETPPSDFSMLRRATIHSGSFSTTT